MEESLRIADDAEKLSESNTAAIAEDRETPERNMIGAVKDAGYTVLPDLIREVFDYNSQDIRTYSPLTLAFIGDCVYEIIVRTVIVERGNKPPQKLQKESAGIVKASTQCLIYDQIYEIATEEEQDIMRRGRNAHFHTKAKNATVSDYKKATGLEALFGYLYLTGRMGRAVELLKMGLLKCRITV